MYGLNGNYAKWELDVKVPAQNVDPRSYNGNDPIFGDGKIGVGSTTLSYTWDGDWHHVVMDGTDGTGTEIWVDGYRIGKVTTAIKAYWVGKPGNDVGIDNLSPRQVKLFKLILFNLLHHVAVLVIILAVGQRYIRLGGTVDGNINMAH